MRYVACVCLLPMLAWPAQGIAQGLGQKVALLQVPKPGGGTDDLCFVYSPGSARQMLGSRVMQQMSPTRSPYYAHFSYEVSPDLTTVTARDFFALRQTRPGATEAITARLYDRPQPDWPCTQQNWAALGYSGAGEVAQNETPSRPVPLDHGGLGPPAGPPPGIPTANQGPASPPAMQVPIAPTGSIPIPGTSPPQIPTETRQEAQTPQAAPSQAQGRQGTTYYTFVEVPVLDSRYEPVLDAAGNPRSETHCLMWRPSWELDRVNVFLLSNNAKFYDALTYHVQRADMAVVMDELAAPRTLYQGGSLQKFDGTTVYKTDIKVKLYTAPGDDWPCSRADWQATLDNLQVLAINPPPYVGGPTIYPRRGHPTVHNRGPHCIPNPNTMSGMYCPQ